MKTSLLISLVLCGVACTPSAFIGSSVPAPAPVPNAMVGSWRPDGSTIKSSGFYDPETLEFDASATPGQFITLTADGHFEEGRVTHSGTGACAVTRYEYHSGTVVVRDTALVLYATAGRVRNVAPCDLSADYEQNDVGVRTLVWHQTMLAVR
jgi:Chaperone for protein-folding within the ER, fungal